MNKNKIIDSHKERLDSFIQKLKDPKGDVPSNVRDSLSNAVLSLEIIEKNYARLNEIQMKNGLGKVSFLRALRDYLQNDADLHYLDALEVASELFRPKFLNPKDPYTYTQAVKAFLEDKLIDLVNARAEERAYFEFRFNKPLQRFLKQHLGEHWLTYNFALYSFLGEQNLPVYRGHVNVPDKHHPAYQTGNSPYDIREKDFEALGHFQGKYSTVWEIVHNNVSSIFYFDKTVEGTLDMEVYEIDPDALPGSGRVDAKFVGQIHINGKHRTESLLKIVPGDMHPERVFGEARLNDDREREFQYSVMRFFVRSGIFNPEDAAYAVRSGEPKYKPLLKIAFASYKAWKETGKRPNDENPSAERIAYEANLLSKLEGITLEDLEATLEGQYASSKKKILKSKQIRDRRPFQKPDGTWANFKYEDKYAGEDEALDKVLALIDLIEPSMLDVRLSIFEAGFFSLTQTDNTVSHIYWIPLIINWREQVTGGAVFLNSDKRIDPRVDWEKGENSKDKDEKKAFYKDGSRRQLEEFPIEADLEVPQEIISALYYLTGLVADKEIGEIEESIRAAAERAAAVSIMSRNISHNIGSHVLSYLKNLLSDESNILNEGLLAELLDINKDDGTIRLNRDLEAKLDRVTLPYLRSVGRLLGYFQERQDYIGTFASDRYLYFSPLHFKDSVVDYFCGEAKFFSADGDRTKYTRNLTLDFIVHSEGYRVYPKGKGISNIDIKAYWKSSKNAAPELLDKKNDILIALPAGNTGRQGIYTILENFIRNSAKHGNAREMRPDQKMEISIILSDEGSDYYKIEVRDNSGNTTDKVVERITEVLSSRLIGLDGNPDERHKGIKEIQIAAGWLRGVRPHELLMLPPPDGLEVLTVQRANPVGEDKGDIQYTFFLRKPKPGLLLVVNRSRYFDLDSKGQEAGLKQEFSTSLQDWDIQELGDASHINEDKVPYFFVAIHQELIDADLKRWRRTYFDILGRNPVRVLTGITDAMLKSEHLQEDLYKAWLDLPQIFDADQSASRFSLVLPPDDERRNAISGSLMSIGIEDRPGSGGPSFANDDLRKLVVNTSFNEARKQSILFREHNDLPRKFDEFQKETTLSGQFDQYLFVEGISGGDSTDRLLRHDTITPLWRYKVIEAALTKVIIIDERVWKNNQGETPEERARNYRRWAKKNIHILSLEFDQKNHPDMLCLKDLEGTTVALLNKMGTAQFTNTHYQDLYSSSHFISLHQGLLERATKHCAESFGTTDEQAQVNILFNMFRRELFVRAKFRVLIHSGRSKTHILPQPTAFVQLSSLGSALRDCKMSLCELLYSTIQETPIE